MEATAELTPEETDPMPEITEREALEGWMNRHIDEKSIPISYGKKHMKDGKGQFIKQTLDLIEHSVKSGTIEKTTPMIKQTIQTHVSTTSTGTLPS